MGEIDLTPIINSILTAVVIPTLIYLWNKYAAPWLKEKKLDKWVEIAVGAAEQLYKTEIIQDRKDYALSILAQKGFKIDDEAVIAALEAAVRNLNIEQKIISNGETE